MKQLAVAETAAAVTAPVAMVAGLVARKAASKVGLRATYG
jgi:hypothetical protein